MADELDKLLRPGERVRYGGAWSLWSALPRRWPQAAVTLFLLFGLLELYGLLGQDWPGLAAGLLVLLSLGVPSLKSYLKDANSEFAVTDARAIVVTEWDGLEITEAAVAEVDRIELFPNAARVTTESGETVVFSPPHRAREIAMVLADAAGLAPPAPPSFKLVVAEQVLAVGRIGGGVAATFAVLHGWLGALPPGDLAIAALAAFHAGRALARLAGLCLLRPVLAYEEMRDWIRHGDLFSTDPIIPAEANWLARWHLRLADLLYGQAASPADRATEDADVALDQLLVPGAQVLYRAPRRWEPNDWLEDLVTLAACLGVAAMARLLTFDEAGLAALAATLGPLCLYILWSYVRDWSREALVSERGLLHRSGWVVPKVIEVDASAVVSVEAHKDKIRITKRDGEIIDLGHPHQAWGLGVALAHAAGAPPPRLPPPKELIGDRVFTALGLFAVIALPLWLLKWLYIFFAGSLPSFSVVGFLCLFLGAALLAGFAGAILGGLVALVLLRPFYSYREIGAWIRHGVQFWPDPSSGAGDDWWRKFFHRFAERLYGRPLAATDQGDKNQGR